MIILYPNRTKLNCTTEAVGIRILKPVLCIQSKPPIHRLTVIYYTILATFIPRLFPFIVFPQL